MRSGNVSKICKEIHDLVGVEKAEKHARGFHHEMYSRLLTPAREDFHEQLNDEGGFGSEYLDKTRG